MNLDELEKAWQKDNEEESVDFSAFNPRDHHFKASKITPISCAHCGEEKRFHPADDEEVEVKIVDGEFCDAGDDEDGDDATIEAGLQISLHYLEALLVMMEKITVHKGRVVKIPRGMTELMEEASEFLEKWEGKGDSFTGMDK